MCFAIRRYNLHTCLSRAKGMYLVAVVVCNGKGKCSVPERAQQRKDRNTNVGTKKKGYPQK